MRYVSDLQPGIARRRTATGFDYRLPDGSVLRDPATLERIGNNEYARSNKSYGLTTLRNRHVAFVSGGRARFRFRGKSGLEHDIVLDDAHLTRLIRHCQQLPGQALFQYRDDDDTLQPVDSGQVNDYLREAMGDGFTAKDFRTWGPRSMRSDGWREPPCHTAPMARRPACVRCLRCRTR